VSHWKDSVLSLKKLKVRQQWSEDGRSDIILHIPITELLEAQARASYAAGVKGMMSFIASMPPDTTPEQLGKLFSAWAKEAGLELAKEGSGK